MANRREFLKRGAAVPAAFAVAPASAEKPKYKACIIGATGRGDYGHGMHLVFLHRPDVQVVALADPDQTNRSRFAAEARALLTYADYHEMLQKERPQLVSIGPRWSVDHRAMIEAAAAVGTHVYMEKPVAPSLEDADAMIAAMEKQNLKCAVAHQMRLAPAIQALKVHIDAGLIGDILELRGRGKEDKRSGGEDLIVLGVHVMDLMRWFVGPDPVWCSARITQDGRDITRTDARKSSEEIGPIAGDTVEATYAFPNGKMGFFASQKNSHGDGGRFGLDIFGTKGAASIRLGSGRLRVEVLRSASWQTSATETWMPLEGFESPDAERVEARTLNALAIDDLIAAIESNRLPQLSIQSARAGLEMTLAPYAAALSGARVELPVKVRKHPLNI